ncbi:MAG: hypothetical protein GVY16_00475 [Planctomycetes bacterium]|jgi:membrane protease subunit HflC|nr:hypothetical protein [Phycisphaerae bacterium]NBB94200.1 hypothetical protein [Planctomycetota bacterium]
MKGHLGIIIILVVVVLALLVSTITFTVDETQDIVLVKRFQSTVRVIDGRETGSAGLHWKWPMPVDSIVRYDSRNHVLVDSYSQLQIDGDANITAQLFCTWRIKDAALLNRTTETVEETEDALSTMLTTTLKNIMGSYRMEEIVNTDKDEMKLDDIEEKVLDAVKVQAMEQYGIEVVDVGIRELGLPKIISQKVIDAMKAERQQEISRYEAAGKAVADAIVGRATAAKQKILEFAKRKAGDIRTQGEARAAESYRKFREQPEFSMFLRSLETLRTALSDRTVFILDAETMPILRWLRSEPTLETFSPR